MNSRAKETIEKGIRRDRFGFEAHVMGAGRRQHRRFPATAHLREIRRWREEAREDMLADAKVHALNTPKLPRSPNGWCYLYFARAGDAVKIGVAVEPESRLRNLRSGHHQEIILLAAIPAHAALERAVHERFANLRLEGEWFRLSDELAEFIHQVRDGRNPVALLW